ncbi:helix-turn-helix domain-containing protein [Micromonospora gifhornensis]|uniref:helix-turn-helix domain-containing protein n=1 Tax=Micromonospora gifhornensis TaxID=84594 RepID=UPI003D72A272
MPRPERPLRPEGGLIAEFAQELRLLREKAGSPKYLQMARRTGRSRTALAEAAGGDHVPSWDTVKAFVEACGDAPETWLPRWERVRDLARESRASVPAGSELPKVPASPQQVNDMSDDVAVLLQLWQEQRNQARQSENQRAVLSALIVAVCAAAGVATVVVQPAAFRGFLATAVVVFGAAGALTCHKYYERHQMHMSEAQHLRQQIDQLRPHLGIERGWADTRRRHAGRYLLVYRLRLHHLWVFVHLVLVVVGLVLLAWVASTR